MERRGETTCGEDRGRSHWSGCLIFRMSNVAVSDLHVTSSVISFKKLNGIVQQVLQYNTRSVITTSTLQLYVDYVSLVNSFLPRLPIFPQSWNHLDHACSTLPNAIANRAGSPSFGKREGTSCPSFSLQKGTRHGFAKHNGRQRLRM